ncbi:MAG: BlaI/MecI/CopY family transcriptional regulator [Clostridia bacterium]|nr:BlaI/MecI/CopY family transcriptional regulator [Clostridia bacterium]
MKQLPQISETEWQVMKVIWTKSPITASLVISQLEESTNWKPKTVKTLLGRLVKKNALGFEKENREYLYYPLVSEQDCVKAENQSFLKRVYDGAFNVMFARFLEEQQLSDKEIDELKRILEEKKPE